MTMVPHTIRLFIYTSDGSLRQRLLAAIDDDTHQWVLETFADLKALAFRLRRCFGEIWMVLLITDAEELGRITAMGELILNNRIILVLPDQTQATVAAGHRLYPRFISYLDSDFSDVRSVLQTMLHNVETHENRSGNRSQ